MMQPRWSVRFLFAMVGLALAHPAAVFAGFTQEMLSLPATTVSGGKAAWADYNNDGHVDLNAGGRLYMNNGSNHPTDGWFTDIWATDNLNMGSEGVWGDYDNDGYVDWFSYATKQLYQNNAGLNFTVVNLPNNLPAGGSRTAAWADFNGDRYLDLYVGQYENWDKGLYYSDFLLINDTLGGFTHTWTQPGHPRPARGTTVADWDRDGDPDVYVSNYRLEPNQLRQNDGVGDLSNDVAGSYSADNGTGHSIGAAWGDFNNDGLFDIFAGNFAHPWGGQPHSNVLENLGPSQNYRFQVHGDDQTGIPYQESYASPTTGDIDNDGDLDVYFTTVYTASSHGPNWPRILRNDGNFRFTDVTASWGLPTGSPTVATYQGSFADFNGDGFLDLVTNGRLYRNNRSHGANNNWLKVSLDGTGSFDRTAIGGEVRISVNGKTLTRQVSSTVGEGNGNDHTMHFGLGTYGGPLDLEITWPDGQVQTRRVQVPNQHVTIGKGPGPDDRDAQIFLSTSDTDPAIENPVLNLGPGQSDSLYVWIKPDDNKIVSAGVDIVSSVSGVIQATAHEIYNPYFELADKNRWDFADDGQIGQLVSDSKGVAYQDGLGISSGLGAVGPPLYDPTTGAFLHSRVDIEAVGLGDAEIFLKVGSGMVRWSLTDQLDGWVLFGDEESYVLGSDIGATNDVADALIHVLVLGDFDGDGVVTGTDIDWLRGAIAAQVDNMMFDVNNDQVVSNADLSYLLADILNTNSADVNLDGVVDAADVAIVRSHMGYIQQAGAAPWHYGNITGDGNVDEVDLISLRFHFGSSGPTGPEASQTTPEPFSALLLATASIALVRRRSPQSL